MVTSPQPSVKVNPWLSSEFTPEPVPVSKVAICTVSPMHATASAVFSVTLGVGGWSSITLTLAVSVPVHPFLSVTVTFIRYSPLQPSGEGMLAEMLSVVWLMLLWVVGVAKVIPVPPTCSQVYV